MDFTKIEKWFKAYKWWILAAFIMFVILGHEFGATPAWPM